MIGLALKAMKSYYFELFLTQHFLIVTDDSFDNETQLVISSVDIVQVTHINYHRSLWLTHLTILFFIRTTSFKREEEISPVKRNPDRRRLNSVYFVREMCLEICEQISITIFIKRVEMMALLFLIHILINKY